MARCGLWGRGLSGSRGGEPGAGARLAVHDDDVAHPPQQPRLGALAECADQHEWRCAVVLEWEGGTVAEQRDVIHALDAEVEDLVAVTVPLLEELHHLFHRVAVERLLARRRQPHRDDAVGQVREVEVNAAGLVPLLVLRHELPGPAEAVRHGSRVGETGRSARASCPIFSGQVPHSPAAGAQQQCPS